MKRITPPNYHPIIFTTEMVQAILAGRKTMTRRLRGLTEINKNPDDWQPQYPVPDSKNEWIFMWRGLSEFIKCPYGQPGDILWVKESYQVTKGKYYYKVNNAGINIDNNSSWKSARFMPFAACRLLLKVNNIRVERIQSITDEDAVREGFNSDYGFQIAWCTMHPGSWERNDWVWVIEFEKTTNHEA